MYERTDSNTVSLDNRDTLVISDEELSKTKTASFLAKVYGYLGIALCITFLIAFGLGYLVVNLFSSAIESGDENALAILLYSGIGTIIVASIGLFVCSIIISLTVIKNKRSILVPGIVYCSLMGILMAGIIITTQQWVFSTAFLVTAIAFGVMFLIGKIFKNCHWLLMMALGTVISGGVMSLVFFLMFPFLASLGMTEEMFYIVVLVDSLFLVSMMFIAMNDTIRIRNIANNGCYSKSLALFCAFTLYTDFINILLKLIRILAIIALKSKKK